MKYYKVINNKEGNLSSAVLPSYHEGFTKYSLEHWVGAPKKLVVAGYHLLVFNNQKAARWFVEHFQSNDIIYRCKVRGIIQKLPPLRTTSGIGFFSTNMGGPWPEGTVMVKKVKLIHEV